VRGAVGVRAQVLGWNMLSKDVLLFDQRSEKTLHGSLPL